MSEWKEYKLKDIGCSFLSGFAFKSSDYSAIGVPLIKIGNIQNTLVSIDDDGDFVSEKLIDTKTEKYLLSDKDVLIAMTGQGSVGRVGRLRLRNNIKPLLNQRVGKFICDEKNINIDYLYFILTSPKYQDLLFNTGVGSGQPNLSPELILNVEIPYTNYNEQTAIAEVLNSLDDKIDLLHRQNKTLEQLAETLFRQWFVEEIEEYWEIGKLEDIASFNNGKSRPNEIENGTIPIYGGNGILGFTNQSNYEGVSIIIGRVGAYCGSLYIENKPIWLSDNALLTRSKQENNFYLFYLLKRMELNTMAEGSSHPLLTQTLLKSIEITIPPTEKEFAFENEAKDYWDKIYSNNNQIKTLTLLRDTLLPKLMSGEVRVNS